jgi:hypothetical protein
MNHYLLSFILHISNQGKENNEFFQEETTNEIQQTSWLGNRINGIIR